MKTISASVRVWDPAVRIGHWLLVIGFFTAYLTEEDFLRQHVWAGYVVAGVVLLRIVWGFTGSQHARFRDFVRGPGATLAYLRGMFRPDSPRYLGHNPAGGAMIVALLLSLVLTCHSGLMVYAYDRQAGPLQSWAQDAGPVTVKANGHIKHSKEYRQTERFWEEWHEFFANFTLALVALHVAGVVLSSRLHRENLVKAMFTGRKRSE